MDGDEALSVAVEKLLGDPRTDPGFDVRGVRQAARAVRLLDEGLRNGLGVYRLMAEGGQKGAETLSSDRLQILSEMVQNADDAGASEIRAIWRPTELLITHDGEGVRLRDVLLLGLPWLSGKARDAEATGRFGIGLATLRALSTAWEVHCHPFHVRFADLNLEPVEPLDLSGDIVGEAWTVFRIPLEPDALSPAELFRWFDTWSDSSLLFLRHLQQITVLRDDPGTARSSEVRSSAVLRLSWRDVGLQRLPVGGTEANVGVREARTTDGSLWRVYDTRVASFGERTRRHKASGLSMPVAVALPLGSDAAGSVHAGLPVVPLDVAVRVNAQFDPVISREEFATSQLNDALVPLVADLWEAAVLDVLGHVEPSAWHLVPLPSQSDATAPARLQHALRAALLDRARNQVAERLSLSLPHDVVAPLSDLAVEEAALSGVIDRADVAQLAGLPHAYPENARDQAGRWRRVLADWRSHGRTGLHDEVQISHAVGLLRNPEYEVGRTIRLTAAAIEAGLGHLIALEPSVVTADARRLKPDSHAYVFAEAEGSGPLDELGVVVDLHPAYREDNRWSRRTVSWLRERSRLVRRDDTVAVLRRIADLGMFGGTLRGEGESRIGQLVALQRALGEVPKKVREQLGPRIGRAVFLDCHRYDADGNEQRRRARPSEAYLSQALESTDGDRFAVAARKTPGLVWVDRSYARSLLPASRNNGLSQTAFLRLLGVAVAPRLVPLLDGTAVKTYEIDHRIGLLQNAASSTTGRRNEMRRLGATHTLDDHICRDLDAVIRDIIAEQDVNERRRRTAALLQTLGKPGLVTSPDQARVQAATAYHGWTVRGQTAALWVWRLREAAWLEDAQGRLRAPTDLRLRTRDAEALYGQDDPGYLHPAIQRATTTRTDVLAALGVSGDPDVPELIARLKQLRARSSSYPGALADGFEAEVFLVYRALAGRLTDGPVDTPRAAVEKEIRTSFLQGLDLVLTDQGWARPHDCFRGTSILRGFRSFALTGPELVPLWTVLGIEEPDADDLVDVLKEIAADGTPPTGERQQVVLEALRSLCASVRTAGAAMSPGLRSKLRWLPLWTSAGWVRKRPVYAVDHPVIARTLADRVPVWQPGGDIQQFTGLLSPLKVSRLEAARASVLDPDGGVPDPQLTQDFRRAVAGLQDILVRDEPEAANAFTGWTWLAELEVRVLPGLRIRLDSGDGGEALELPVDAQIDRTAKALFVSTPEALRTTRGGGLAVASFFSGERTHVGHRWRDFWETDVPDQPSSATPLVSARQHDHEEQQRMNDLLRQRKLTMPGSPATLGTPRGTSAPSSAVPAPRSAAAPPVPAVPSGRPVLPLAVPPVPGPRELHTAAELGQRSPQVSRVSPSVKPARPGEVARRRRVTSLPGPRLGEGAPRERSGPLSYQDRDKEKLVIELLAQFLRKDEIDLHDQRGVLRLGADAVDSNGHFYEIKAHGGAEPTDVSLTSAEFTRALAEGENLSLVIASYLEQGTGEPTLRIIKDPLRHFEVEPVSDVKLKAVRDVDAEALVLQWPADGS
ncbi:ATP-binding protein [Kitasatospora sp. NPDC057965]|uniref:ATP-binding protein n=1 Tax=Kitasatospora sp. NPDC057965 TaxID=3346291 RepID=UPI0036DD722B